LLGQYRTLKEAARDSSLAPLFEKINSPRPMAIRAGTNNGWFELQLGQQEFGPLPKNDRLLLAGQETVPDDPLQNLAGGVLDVAWMRLMDELNATLIQYTPLHFESIHCRITEDLEQGQRALFYDIQCPQFPNEGTTQPNARLHTAATHVVQHVAAERGTFSEASSGSTCSPTKLGCISSNSSIKLLPDRPHAQSLLQDEAAGRKEVTPDCSTPHWSHCPHCSDSCFPRSTGVRSPLREDLNHGYRNHCL
jgi:hypothetical protein